MTVIDSEDLCYICDGHVDLSEIDNEAFDRILAAANEAAVEAIHSDQNTRSSRPPLAR